jgi:hypothetical protein
MLELQRASRRELPHPIASAKTDVNQHSTGGMTVAADVNTGRAKLRAAQLYLCI